MLTYKANIKAASVLLLLDAIRVDLSETFGVSMPELSKPKPPTASEIDIRLDFPHCGPSWIEWIKAFRIVFPSFGLKEAKDFTESLPRNHPMSLRTGKNTYGPTSPLWDANGRPTPQFYEYGKD